MLAADVLYLRASVEAALALMPRLVAPGGEIRLADPRRAGARDFLAAARATFTVRTRQDGRDRAAPADAEAASRAPLNRAARRPAQPAQPGSVAVAWQVIPRGPTARAVTWSGPG